MKKIREEIKKKFCETSDHIKNAWDTSTTFINDNVIAPIGEFIEEEVVPAIKDGLQATVDFGKGLGIGLLRNAGKVPFEILGAVTDSNEVQTMPDKIEPPGGVENKVAYEVGKITADIAGSVGGVVQIVSGLGEIIVGAGGDVFGGLLCTTGVGAAPGGLTIAASTGLIVKGVADIAGGASVSYSSANNFGNDMDDLNKVRSDKKATSPNQMNNQVKRGQAPRKVKRVDNSDPQYSEPHVHFDDGTSITASGKVHDAQNGSPQLTNEVLEWLHKNGWCLNIN